MGCQLFRHMCQEEPSLLKECEEDILKSERKNYVRKTGGKYVLPDGWGKIVTR